ncbi:MAG TPA: thiamine pyrophosphate-dependent enzyme [Candidatus Limnocylindria bacterium]|nr:thiamine pyrophosphate-dependent enzyme [Candidatus Limnocylindria bacterium]
MKTSPRASAAGVVTPRAKLRLSAEEVIADYRLAFRSRVASVLGRREVLTGKAPFGIFGDGKEVAQLAMAKAFRPGDWRTGYYRDQTFALATGMATLPQYFAQLYADTEGGHDPFSAGRQMVSHFASRTIGKDGRWERIVELANTASDLSPVAAQLPRALGLAYASKLFREDPGLREVADGFSKNGDEVTFATSGNAGTSEGMFWETLNAAGVLQVPLAISIWDDGFGISVPNEIQTTKGSISKLLAGFAPADGLKGVDIHTAKGWDYAGLCDLYALAIPKVRKEHAPALLHITEMTQPQGHSTSGSHERYKTPERLRFETEGDPIARMRRWMIEQDLATAQQLDELEAEDRRAVEEIRAQAWEQYQEPLREERARLVALLERVGAEAADAGIGPLLDELRAAGELSRRLVVSTARRALVLLRGTEGQAAGELAAFVAERRAENEERFNSHLLSSSELSPARVEPIAPVFSGSSETVDGRIVLLRCFDANLARDPRIHIIGEDIGKLGDVNLVFEGLQAKHGPLRLTDTGIREATIMGQGIGAALRGLRPIVDIQYVDYLLYALELASDDLATLRFRTAGAQQAPVVIRTKGHRLQGIWHTGSPMGVIINALRGIHVAVPRDMVQAAGFYNTFLRGDDPALVIEVLNGYRFKERLPDNVGEFTLPIGVPETIREGSDVTLVTYGALCRIALEACATLEELGISVEVIDVRTLLPFDTGHTIVGSVKRTNALIVVDEDVPGGASAYVLQQILETQRAYEHIDVLPRTLTAKPNRTGVGQDSDYFSKPNREDIVEAVYALMRERDPRSWPGLGTGD